MRALVTGGGGFLGRAIVDRLLDRGARVRVLNRRAWPDLEARGVEGATGDLADAAAVDAAVAGCDAVFHVAAKAGVWGAREAYYQTNVVGTDNVLTACARHGVRRLVYTSTPSVVHAGEDIEGVDESCPYPEHFETHYPETKATAERAVLAANGPELSTVALRPHLIWGPGDNHLVPRIVARARSGRLRLVGGGSKLVDTVYVDNAAEAHLLALDRLAPGAACAGRAYFITQGDPRPMAEIVNGIVAAAGLPPVTRSLSPGAAAVVGAMLENVYRAFRIRSEPPLTRFVARQLATAHWYDIGAARRDLGYRPGVTIEQGLERLRAAFEAGTAIPPTASEGGAA